MKNKILNLFLKVKLTCVRDLRAKIIKFLEENEEEYLCGFSLDRDFQIGHKRQKLWKEKILMKYT